MNTRCHGVYMSIDVQVHCAGGLCPWHDGLKSTCVEVYECWVHLYVSLCRCVWFMDRAHMPVVFPVGVFAWVTIGLFTFLQSGLARPGVPQCPLGKGRAGLTLPRSRMKQSPLLKLSQDTGTSVARTVRRPLTWKSLCTTTSLGTTCLNPDATPPFCWVKETGSVQGEGPGSTHGGKE